MGDQIPFLPTLTGEGSAKPRLTTLQKAEFIRSVDVFSQASVEELYRLAPIAKEVAFAAEEVIFQEDDIGDAFYLVVEGKVESVSSKTSSQEIAGPGEAVGLFSVLTREPRYSTARTLERTFAISISAEDLYSLLSNNMEIVVSIFKHFVKKLGLGPRV